MTPALAAPQVDRLRRRAAVLGLVAALGTGALVPLSTSSAASAPASPSAEARPAVAKTVVLTSAATRRAITTRQAQRSRLVPSVTSRSGPAGGTKSPAASAAKDEAAIYQQRLHVLVNQERAKRGLRPLARATCGDGYASRWASSMARRGVMEHQQLRPILGACKARGVAENIAFGNVTADRMMQMWMNSPGHRTNILRPEMTHIGLGSVERADGRVYGCQLFLALK